VGKHFRDFTITVSDRHGCSLHSPQMQALHAAFWDSACIIHKQPHAQLTVKAAGLYSACLQEGDKHYTCSRVTNTPITEDGDAYSLRLTLLYYVSAPFCCVPACSLMEAR
jgi:hypothetical protein